MKETIMSEMLKAGVHFGHQKSKWNPKMKPYIYGVKNNIHIINLAETEEKLKKALEFIRSLVKNGELVLFVGTKKQVKKLVEETAKSVNMPYASERWLGGAFTNSKVIIKRLDEFKAKEIKYEKGEFAKYTKKEQLDIKREIAKMNHKMGGLKTMVKTPKAIFIVDILEDEIALKEARKVGIPIVAMVDTNTDPSLVDYPIPSNDDAVASVKFILNEVEKAIKEARAGISDSAVKK